MRKLADSSKKRSKCSPNFIEPLGQLVAMDFAQNRQDAALERVQKQIALVPESGPLQLLLGRVHMSRGEKEQAETAYLRAVELEPDLVAAHAQLGNLYASGGDYDKALEKFDKALQEGPETPSLLARSGIVQQMSGDVASAVESYRKALKINPRYAVAANNLAYILSQNEADQEQALELAQMAREVAPQDPRIADTLGWILYQRGIYQHALTLIQESAEKLSGNAEVLYHLGMTHYKLGNREEARRALSEAMKRDGGFSGADEARSTLEELQ